MTRTVGGKLADRPQRPQRSGPGRPNPASACAAGASSGAPGVEGGDRMMLAAIASTQAWFFSTLLALHPA